MASYGSSPAIDFFATPADFPALLENLLQLEIQAQNFPIKSYPRVRLFLCAMHQLNKYLEGRDASERLPIDILIHLRNIVGDDPKAIDRFENFKMVCHYLKNTDFAGKEKAHFLKVIGVLETDYGKEKLYKTDFTFKDSFTTGLGLFITDLPSGKADLGVGKDKISTVFPIELLGKNPQEISDIVSGLVKRALECDRIIIFTQAMLLLHHAYPDGLPDSFKTNIGLHSFLEGEEGVYKTRCASWMAAIISKEDEMNAAGLGSSIAAFCYPYGVADDDATADLSSLQKSLTSWLGRTEREEKIKAEQWQELSDHVDEMITFVEARQRKLPEPVREVVPTAAAAAEAASIPTTISDEGGGGEEQSPQQQERAAVDATLAGLKQRKREIDAIRSDENLKQKISPAILAYSVTQTVQKRLVKPLEHIERSKDWSTKLWDMVSNMWERVTSLTELRALRSGKITTGSTAASLMERFGQFKRNTFVGRKERVQRQVVCSPKM